MMTGIRVYADVLMGSSPLFLWCRKSSHFPLCRQRHHGAEIEKLDAFRYISSVARVPLVANCVTCCPCASVRVRLCGRHISQVRPEVLCIMNAMACAFLRDIGSERPGRQT